MSILSDEQSSVTKEISSSTVHTASAREVISSVIQGVGEKSLLNQEASVDVSKAAGELSDMAVHLQRLVVRFSIENAGQSYDYKQAA